MNGNANGHSSPAASGRVASLSLSAPTAIGLKAKQLRSDGRDIVVFGAGEPDYDTPRHIYEAAENGAEDPDNHRYTPHGGLAELREALARKTRQDTGLEISPSEVVVTNGGKQAIFNALAAVVDPGDEVLIPTPHWTSYPHATRLVHGVPVPVFSGFERQYKVSVNELEAARTPRTKVLIFNSPSNPTGAVYSRDEVVEICAWARAYGIWVISDDIYEHFVYDRSVFTSVLPMLRDQCVAVNGFSKAFAMTGWRLGWLIAPPSLASSIINLQSHTTGNVSNVTQRAGLAALAGGLNFTEEMRRTFDRRRRLIVEGLNAIPGFRLQPPKGAFYAYPDVTQILGEKAIRGRVPRTSLELANILLEEADVAVVPGEAFGPSGYLRFSYALADRDLIEGVRRIRALIEE